MKRWKLYFAYAHLPPHLQAVSKPFHDAAAALVEFRFEPDRAAFDALVYACIESVEGAVDPEEKGMCRGWLNSVLEDLGDHACGSATMRDLLRAKDCAVRAHIPDPPEVGS